MSARNSIAGGIAIVAAALAAFVETQEARLDYGRR